MILKQKKYKLIDLIGLPLRVAPLWGGLMFLTRLGAAFVPALLVLATANFIDTALSGVVESGPGVAMVWAFLAIGAIVAFQWLNRDVAKFFRSKILLRTRWSYQMELIEKRASLEYRYIEDPETYDLIKRVVDPSETQIINQLNETLGLLDLLIQTFSLALILFVNIWWAALLILIFSIPTFYFAIKAGETMYDRGRDVSKVERKARYLVEVCSGRDGALERSLFDYGRKMTAELWDRFEFARIHKQVARKKEETNIATSGILLSLISGIVMLTLVQPVAAGTLSLGLFMSLTVACVELTHVLTNNLPERMTGLATNKEYLKDLTKFLNLSETKGALEKPSAKPFDFERLELKNVSFTYPGTKKPILTQVNLKMERGKHYAFVGENGAGKTTLIKLLTGLYQDYEGEIFINGIELRTFKASKLKSVLTVAYQDFAKYQLTIRENLLIGYPNLKTPAQMTEVLMDLEMDRLIERLPLGLETPLGKIFEAGTDLSGGQWQRIALARAILNPAPLKILDEPTAALDPLSESRLYEQFEKIMAGRTSIFISHRLGSTKLADEIFVFDQGTIAETGTHEQLMDGQGKYAQMYTSQLAWYQTEGEVA